MKKHTLLVLPLLIALVAVFTASAVAQITPAGTQIRNRSAATYEDMGGSTFNAISNEVITIVLPVYGLSILPDDSGDGPPPSVPAMTQNALAGMTVYYRYDLVNTGNASDNYTLAPNFDGVNSSMALAASDISIYNDLNGNGVVNVGEPVISSGGAPGVVGPVAAGATVSIIVSYAVPVAAASGQLAYAGVDGASTSDGAQIDLRNHHLTRVVNDAVMTANLTGAPGLVFPGDQITYTLSGTNVGNNVANGVTVPGVGTGVLLYDVIPVDAGGNPFPVFGAPAGLPAGGTALYLPVGSSTAGSPETWPWSTTAGFGDIAVGYLTTGAIITGQSYSFTYQVSVPTATPAGVLGNTAALVSIDNAVPTPNTVIVVSNNANVTIGVAADVVIGPQNNAGAGTAPGFNDDVQSIATAYAGTSVTFVNTVRNDGNAADRVNILRDGASTIPGTWTLLFLQSDGITPLADTGSDGIPDVGFLAPGDSANVVVRVVIPGNQPSGGPFDAVVRAQSTNDPGQSNLTADRIASVVSSGVNIGNYDAAPGTTNDALVSQNANPSTSVDFALDVINTSGGQDTFTLSSGVPGGWGVTYFADANGNGVVDATETTPIAFIGPLAGFAEAHVVARVSVPAGTPPGANPVSFTATSSNNPTSFDTIGDQVVVNSAASVLFTPDLGGSGTPGGTVSYTHTVTNTGNVGDVYNLSYVSSQGWTYSFFDALNAPLASIALAPGASATVIVHIAVPAGATLGTIDTGVLTATGASASDSATDVTVVVAGDLRLTKAVSPATDQPPGAILTYTTDYQNTGTSTLTSLVIVDARPSATQFQVGSESVGVAPAGVTAIVTEFSSDGGSTWAYAPVSGGGGAPAGFDAAVTNIRWVFTGTLDPGDASTAGVGFAVRIIAE